MSYRCSFYQLQISGVTKNYVRKNMVGNLNYLTNQITAYVIYRLLIYLHCVNTIREHFLGKTSGQPLIQETRLNVLVFKTASY